MSKISNKRDNIPKPSIVAKSVIATKSAIGTRSNIPIKPDIKMIPGVVKKAIIAAKPGIATNRGIATKTGIATKPGIATKSCIATKSGIATKPLPVKKPELNTFPVAVKKTRTSFQPNVWSPSISSQKKSPSNLDTGSSDVQKSGFVSKSSNLKALMTKQIPTSPQSRKSFGVLRTERSSNCEGSASGCSSDIKRRAFGAMVTKSCIPRTGINKPSANRKPSSYNESLSSRISNKPVLDQTIGHKLEISTNSSAVEGQERIKESPKLATNSDLFTKQNRISKKKLTSTPRNHHTFPRIFPSTNSVISLTSSFPPPSLRRLPGSDKETVLEGVETRTLIEEAARLSLGVEAMTIMVGAGGKTDGQLIKDHKMKEENSSLEMRKIMNPATGDKIKQLERDIERMQRKQEEALRAQEEVHRCREESLRLELERKEQEREEKYKVMIAQEKEEHRKNEDWYHSEVKRLTQQIQADSAALKIALEKKEILETIVNELEVKVNCLETVLREFSKMTNIDQEVVNANVKTKLMALMAKRVKCDFEGDIEAKGL